MTRYIGEKIKRMRSKQEMSRQEFCEAEDRLSVRQLLRIENGQSLPSLESLDFIASRFGISMSELIKDTKF